MKEEENNGTNESRVDSKPDDREGASVENIPEDGAEGESAQAEDDDVEFDMSEIQYEAEAEPLLAEPPAEASGSIPEVPSQSAQSSAKPSTPPKPSMPSTPPKPPMPPMPPMPGIGVCEEEEPGRGLLEDAIKLSAGDRWDFVLQRLNEEETSSPDNKFKAFLQYEAGEILESRKLNNAEAGKAYARAMKLSPGLFPNLWAVRRILAERGRWENVIKLLDAEIKLTDDNQRKADIWLEKGRIYESNLKHDDLARDAYFKAHELVPDLPDPIMALERILASEGNMDELVKIIGKHADVIGESTRKAVILQNLARIMGETGSSDYEERRAILLKALDHANDAESVLWDLGRIAVADERFEHLFEVLGIRAERAEDEGRIEESIAYRRQQAGIGYRRLGSVGLAWDALRPIWDAALKDLTLVRSDLIVLAWVDKRWNELSELLERCLQEDLAPEEQAALRYEQHLALRFAGDHESAQKVLEELWENHSDHLPVLLTRESAALEKGDPAEIAGVLAELRKFLESETCGGEKTKDHRAALLSVEANLWMEVVDSLEETDGVDDEEGETVDRESEPENIPAIDRKALIEKAADCCREASALGVCSESAAYLLEEILGRLGRWDELAAHMKERSETVEGAEKLRCLEVLADISRVYLSQSESEIWALEQMVQSDSAIAFNRLRLADAWARAGGWGRAAQLLEDSAEIYVDPEKQADLLFFSALLSRFRENNTQAAKTRLRKAREAEPDHATAGVMLEDLLIETEDWRGLADYYEEEASRSMDESRIERLLIQKGEILELRLGRDNEALKMYEEVSEKFPESFSAPLLIARVLRRGAGGVDKVEDESQSGDQELAALLERDAENAVDEAVRAELLSLAASFYESGGDPEGVERGNDCLKRAFSLLVSNRVITEKLVLRTIAGENWPQLCEILDEHLSAIQDQPDDSPTWRAWRREVLELLAWAQELALAQPDEAMEKWQGLRFGERGGENDVQPGDEPDQIKSNMIEWASMRRAVRDKNIVDYCKAATSLAEEVSSSLGDGLRLRTSVHEAFNSERSDRDEPPLKTELGRLASFVLGIGDSSVDCGFLQEHSEKKEDTPWLFAAALSLLKEGSLLKAGEIIEKILENSPEHYGAALVAVELARKAGDASALADGSYTLGTLCKDPETASEAFMEAAKLYMDSGNNGLARRVLENVLAIQPEHEVAYKMMAELLEAERDWEGLCKLLTHRLAVRKDDLEETEIYLKRANLQLEKLGSKRNAAEDFHRALRVDPGEIRAMTDLARLYAADGDDEKAEELLQMVCEGDVERARKRDALMLLAEILERRRMDPERAGKLLEEAVGDEPESDDREMMLAFYVRQRKWDKAEKIFEKLEEAAESKHEKTIVLRRKARFYRELMASEKKADETLLRARRLSPLDIVVVERLAESYERLKDKEALQKLLSNALQDNISSISDAPSDIRIYRNLSRIRGMEGECDGEFFALSALRLFDGLTSEEKEKFGGLQNTTGKETVSAMEERVWKEHLCHQAVYSEGVWGLWCAMRDPVQKIYHEDLSVYGVDRSNRLDSRSLKGAARDIASAMSSFGVKPVECYLWPKEPARFKVLILPEPVVLVGEELTVREDGLTSGELYLFGKEIAAARLGVSLLLSRSDEEVERIFEAAASEGYSGFSPRYPVAELAPLGKSIKKALGWGNRKALNLPAEVFAKSGESIAEWLNGVKQTCIRTGLAFSRDLTRACLDAGGREGSEWSELADPVVYVADHEDVKDMLYFAVSNELLVVRRELISTERK